MTSYRKQTVLEMVPLIGGPPWVEIYDAESVSASYWAERLQSMAETMEAEAVGIRSRGTTSRNARRKAALLESAALYRAAAGSISDRIEDRGNGRLAIRLGPLD